MFSMKAKGPQKKALLFCPLASLILGHGSSRVVLSSFVKSSASWMPARLHTRVFGELPDLVSAVSFTELNDDLTGGILPSS